MRLDVKSSSYALDKRASCRTAKQKQNSLSSLSFSYLFNAELENFMSDFDFENSRMRNDFIFGMLYFTLQ